MWKHIVNHHRPQARQFCQSWTFDVFITRSRLQLMFYVTPICCIRGNSVGAETRGISEQGSVITSNGKNREFRGRKRDVQKYSLAVTPLGTAKSYNCNQMVPYSVTVFRHCLQYERPFGKWNKCHFNKTALFCVTETGVIVSEYVCNVTSC